MSPEPLAWPVVDRPLAVRSITAREHAAVLAAQPSASFLQTPGWGRLKSDWSAESVGWYAAGAPESLVGAALVLYRQIPRLPRYLAYVPEGPVLDWTRPDALTAITALAEHVRARGAFALRLGPPVPRRRWRAETVKQAIADPQVRTLNDVTPDVAEPVGEALAQGLAAAGFHRVGEGPGFAAGQPHFVFQMPLAGRTEADLLAGMNQLWRRSIKKSVTAGVEVSRGGVEDLADFHRIYAETAARDGFLPRPVDYFRRMFAELQADLPDSIRLYLARHEGDLVAAGIWVRVGRHSWYAYGASTTLKREVQGSTAMQWQMMRDALAAEADVYDLRGITDTVDEHDPLMGLVRFKLGTGGEAVEYVGEWDLPVRPLTYRAFELAQRIRR